MIKQRYKLYACEAKVWPYRGSTTPEAGQLWFDWVARTKWWRDHSPIRHFRLKFPCFGKMSGIILDGDVAEVEYGAFSLTLQNFVHDLAHILDYHPGASREQMERDHSPVFAGFLLALVKRYMSADEAKELQSAFDDAGVKYDQE